MIGFYSFLTRLAAPLIRGHVNRRAARGKEDPARLNERFGQPSLARPAGPLLWLHGASVGETISVLPLIEGLLQRNPNLNILLTSGTVTSAALMAQRLPERAFHQYVPVDMPVAVAGFLDHWRPQGAIWVESELWPNLLLATARRAIPMALVNARMSARSHATWRKFPNSARRLMQCFRLCLAQSGEDAERYRALGAGDVRSLGNLKDLASPLPFDALALEDLRRAIGARPTWLAASTHPGEEQMILEAHVSMSRQFPSLLTLLAPRHPERGDAVAALVRQAGLGLARRSRGELPHAGTGVYLVDTLGHMGLLYRATELVLMGGSLLPIGGHNPLEPGRIGAAQLFGPHMENFKNSARRLLDAGAARCVIDARQLATAVTSLLEDSDARRQMVAAGLAATQSDQQVLESILLLIETNILGSRHAGASHAGA